MGMLEAHCVKGEDVLLRVPAKRCTRDGRAVAQLSKRYKRVLSTRVNSNSLHPFATPPIFALIITIPFPLFFCQHHNTATLNIQKNALIA